MATYYVWSGAAGAGTGASWANAYTSLPTATNAKSGGDTFFVAHDHVESSASSITLQTWGSIANPTKIICVDRAGTVPPVSADRRTTAQLSTTGATNISTNGCAHFDGIIFSAGSGAVSAHLQLASVSDSKSQRFDNCSLRLAGTGGGFLGVGVGMGGTYVECNNTTVSFAGVTSSINVFGMFKWRNTASALLGTIPTTLFTPTNNAARGGWAECIGVDLSAAGSGKTIVGSGSLAQAFTTRFVDCKLNASVTKSAVPTAHGATEIDFIRSGSSGVNYTVHRHRITGLLIEEITIIRTGGASDGVTPLSWKVTTTAECNYSMPFECPPIAIWNDTTGSAVTATVEGIWGGGAVPLDDEIWLDVEYLGDASSPQASFVNDGKANLLATAANQTSSSETWGGSTTKFKLNVTFTAQQAGWIYCRIKIGKASSVLYVDPLVTLT